ncbi:Ig-like domain-containing protein [Spirosoma endbachense]|uniref:T9SS type A sorting domain-containing protein n=1 Tax=Spirosoma endbachense TaxID=2666025 RepID=A0A6P1W8I2_9BACT|nr:Ig-like domain-containing protein [Spirosoma endbachense]QHW00330.1 T9SS type A sorting domain-containing protein [Spirosoma endbachense]
MKLFPAITQVRWLQRADHVTNVLEVSVLVESGLPFRKVYRRIASLALVVVLLVSQLGFATNPTVRLNTPGNKAAFMVNTTITLRATAFDAEGKNTISKVEFYSGTNKLGEGTVDTVNNNFKGENVPYSFTWTATSTPGTYQISAKVIAGGATVPSSNTATVTFHPTTITSNKIYYVQPGAAASGTGTQSSPFLTIQQAADLTLPGDKVYLLNPINSTTYFNNTVVIRRTGRNGYPIIYTHAPGNDPLITFDGWNAFSLVDGASYIEINDLRIQGNNDNITIAQAQNQPGGCNNLTGTPEGKFNGNGLSASGRRRESAAFPHHIKFVGNEVFDCGGGGISAIECDYITIDENTVYDNSWDTIYGSSGISILTSRNIDSNTGYRNFIRKNKSYGNHLYVNWIAAPCAITDGNGIIIDSNKDYAYTGRTLVSNNVVWNNGGSGIHSFKSQHVDLFNNTAYQNSQSAEPVGELYASYSTDINIFNNIIYTILNERANTTNNNSAVNYDYNLYYNTPNNSTTIPGRGPHDIYGANPQFVNPTLTATADFRLNPASPALNVGNSTSGQYAVDDIAGVTRPKGGVVDIGAFEANVPAIPSNFTQSNLQPTQVTFTWIDNATNETGFVLEKRVLPNGSYTTVVSPGVNATTATDNQILKGTSYRYRLASKNASGPSGYVYTDVTTPGARLSAEGSTELTESEGYFTISPNPVESQLIVIAMSYQTVPTIQLVTADGRLVSVKIETPDSGHILVRPLKHLATGTYIVTVKTDIVSQSKRVLIP